MNFSSNELILIGAAVVAFLFANAMFVATEFSLIKLRFTRFGTDEEDQAKDSIRIAALLDDLSGSLRVIRFGTTVCSIAVGVLSVPLALEALDSLGLFADYPVRTGVVLGLILSIGIHFVVGELVPRAIGMQNSVGILKVIALPLGIFKTASYPFYRPCIQIAEALLKSLGYESKSDFDSIEVDSQIRSIVSSGEELPEVTESILNNAMDLRKRVAHDIMIPRNQLRFFDVEDSIEENIRVARETGHTRFPVCEGDLDRCIGIVHIKDVFRTGKPTEEIDLNQLKRSIPRFSTGESLEAVLQEFLKQKQHFALLIDEFGGAVGAVTLEDVLEELVGEIQDEFDLDKEMISRLAENAFLVDGLTPLHDVAEEIGVELESEEVSTFGGYITLKLGRMPHLNEVFRIDRLQITVGNVDDRRVIAASIEVLSAKKTNEEAEEKG